MACCSVPVPFTSLNQLLPSRSSAGLHSRHSGGLGKTAMRMQGSLDPAVRDGSSGREPVCSSSCHSPLFLACEMRSAALLLITLVT